MGVSATTPLKRKPYNICHMPRVWDDPHLCKRQNSFLTQRKSKVREQLQASLSRASLLTLNVWCVPVCWQSVWWTVHYVWLFWALTINYSGCSLVLRTVRTTETGKLCVINHQKVLQIQVFTKKERKKEKKSKNCHWLITHGSEILQLSVQSLCVCVSLALSVLNWCS